MRHQFPMRESRELAGIYLAAPTVDPRVLPAYSAFVAEIEAQFASLSVRVDFVDGSPYASASEMFREIDRGSVKIMRTGSGGDESHPVLTNRQNDLFRAVHDVLGHAKAGTGFDRHGEYAAWLCHRETFSPSARMALACETRAQTSSLIVTGEFPAQKAVFLPDWAV